MTEIGDDDDTESMQHLVSNAEPLKNAWEATIEDMKSMAAELEEDGWDAVYVGAGDTAPKSPNADEDSEWGLVYVIPNNYADAFTEAYERGVEEGEGFDRYEVYRSEQAGSVFQVTVLYDDPTRTAILLAGSYQLLYASNLMDVAIGGEEMYTHVKLLDGTVLGRFHHDGYEAFFPNAKQRLFGSTDDADSTDEE